MDIFDREKETRHESFGKISLSKCSGHPTLFCSDINPNYFFTLTVHHACVSTNSISGEEHVSAEGAPVVRINMSTHQLMELLLKQNLDDGVPCTLEVINGKSITPPPDEIANKRERMEKFFKDKIKGDLDEIKQQRNKVAELLEKKSLSKTDRNEINNVFSSLLANLQNNYPFYLELFSNGMDELKVKAKSEINAMIHGIAEQVGAEQLNLTEFNKYVEKLSIQPKTN